MAPSRMPCIYKITRISDNTIIYVGSSRDLECRKISHLKESIREKKSLRKVYTMIQENGDWDNHSLEHLELTEKEGTDLLWLERKYFDELKPIGNTRRPICTEEERKVNEEKTRAVFYHRWRKNQK